VTIKEEKHPNREENRTEITRSLRKMSTKRERERERESKKFVLKKSLAQKTIKALTKIDQSTKMKI